MAMIKAVFKKVIVFLLKECYYVVLLKYHLSFTFFFFLICRHVLVCSDGCFYSFIICFRLFEIRVTVEKAEN